MGLVFRRETLPCSATNLPPMQLYTMLLPACPHLTRAEWTHIMPPGEVWDPAATDGLPVALSTALYASTTCL